MPRIKKSECRIDAVVESEEDRDRIYAAADAAQQSARVFVGQAALRAASPESMQIARLEHITEAQERLTAELETLKLQLQELSANLTMVVQTSAKSIAQHAETHKQLDLAMEKLERAFEERETLRRQLDTALDGHSATQRRLTEIHACLVSPSEMDEVRRSFQYIVRIVDHLGIKLDDED